MIMKTCVKLFFENIAFINSNILLKLKKWIGQLIKLLMNWGIHIKFHPKFFIMIKYALKNEIIKSGVIFLKPYSNGNYWFLKDQSWTLFFNHPFEMDFIVIFLSKKCLMNMFSNLYFGFHSYGLYKIF